MAFDLEGARKAGYSDAEIADHLAQNSKFDTAGARKAGYSDAEIISHFGAAQARPPETPMDQFVGGVKRSLPVQVVLGGLRGAAGIGATLQHALNPMEWGNAQANAQRRGDIESGTQALGGDPNSLVFQGAKLGTEVAGTAGVGGPLAKLLQYGGRFLPALNALVEPVATAGFRSGVAAAPAGASALTRLATGAQDIGARAVGGGLTGGASAGLINPGEAGMGAAIGAALPPALKGAGAGGALVARLLESGDRTAARSVANAMGAGDQQAIDALVGRLRGAQEIVPGSRPTVSQVTMNPGSSALEDIVHDVTMNNALRNLRQQQATARLAAVENVAPVQATGPAQARQDLGEALARRVIPEERAISDEISKLYEAVDPQKTSAIRLPLQDMQNAASKYLGPGTVGQGAEAQQVIDAALNMGHLVPFENLQTLRSSIDGLARRARMDPGRAKEAAALSGMKESIDARMADAASGNLLPGENFTQSMRDAFQSANAAHANKIQRFKTGPQRDIFRTGPNGEPLLQGGEVAGKFWGNRPGAADDVIAFRRLVDDNPAMLGQFRSMVATEGAGTASRSGLEQRYVNWISQNLPALRNTFEPAQLEALQNVSADIERSGRAAAAGGARGSKTFQNAANAMKLGLVENPGVQWLANKIPLGGPVLTALRESTRTSQGNRLAEILADPEQAATALELLTRGRTGINQTIAQIPYRVAPQVLTSQ